MPVLTEVEALGKSWIRAKKIEISNELDANPSITYTIEKAIEIGGETVTKSMATMSREFDPYDTILVRNPITGELTGQTVTKADIYTLIYSAFWADAIAAGVVDIEDNLT